MPQLTAYENYTMVAAGGTKTFSTIGLSNTYNLLPNGGTTVLLAGNLTIDPTGTPVEGMQYVFNFGGLMAYDGGTITIFSRLMTAAEALTEYTITCTYTNAAWVVKFEFSDLSSISGTYLATGTVDGSKLIAQTVALAKLVVGAARGYFIRAGASGVWEAANGVTSGNLIMGNGTDVASVAMSGDATITGVGAITIGNDKITTVKILDANVTAAKLSTEAATLQDRVTVSFETGELGIYKLPMYFSGSVVNVYAEAVKAIAATDTATVILKDNAGTTMTVTTPIVFAASDVFGTAYSSAVTANNTFVDGDVITITTAKTTAGGKALVTLEILRS